MGARIIMPVETGTHCGEAALQWIPAAAGMTNHRHARADGHPLWRSYPPVDSRSSKE